MGKFKLCDYNHLMDFSDIDMTAKEAICAKCHECCCFQATEVKQCKQTDCALYKFKEKWYKIPKRRVYSAKDIEHTRNMHKYRRDKV